MKSFFKQLKATGLGESERQEIRSSLRKFLAAHPAPASARLMDAPGFDWRDLLSHPLASLMRKPAIAGLALSIVLASGVGTALAAEQSLPGDTLYGIKIHVNEEVRSALAVGAQNKADWEAQRAGRRLEEVEKLSARKRLNADLSAKLQQEIAAQTKRVNQGIDQLKKQGNTKAALDVSAHLQTQFSAHAQILSALESATKVGDAQSQQLQTIEKDVDSQAKATATDLQALESQMGQAPAQETSSAASSELSEAVAAVDQVKALFTQTSFPEKQRVSAQRQLNQALRHLEQAKMDFDKQRFGASLSEAQRTQHVAGTLNLLLKSAANLGVDVQLSNGQDVDSDKDRQDVPTGDSQPSRDSVENGKIKGDNLKAQAFEPKSNAHRNDGDR